MGCESRCGFASLESSGIEAALPFFQKAGGGKVFETLSVVGVLWVIAVRDRGKDALPGLGKRHQRLLSIFGL
ncbi:hypothetical protein QUB13_10100 [Microcoleus sp. B4-D4]